MRKHIFITGASSGLGRSLALLYALRGRTLTLWARDRERLEETARLCRDKGAETIVVRQDVRDLEGCRDRLQSCVREHPVDLAILAAGVITGVTPEGVPEPVEDACRTVAVNALGAINMASCLYSCMAGHGRGHIVLVASAAGFYPLPNSPSYAASKIAVNYYARALHGLNPIRELRVSCVCPGYLDTPMGRRLIGDKPFLLEPERAALLIRDRLEAGKDFIVFPRLTGLGVRALHLMPERAAQWLAKKLGYTVVPDRESPLAEGREGEGMV